MDLESGGTDVEDENFQELLREIEDTKDTRALDELRRVRLGKKGRLTEAMKGLSTLSPDARRAEGARLNHLRQQLLEAFGSHQHALELAEETRELARERIDMTIPGVLPRVGLLHPLTRVRRRIEDVLLRMGFSLEYGPQVESEWRNFTALNMPANHPARDMQDSFFPDVPGLVLRTHTSPVQIRAMQKAQGRLPLKILAPGAVYRRDDDATHVPMFQQVEGLVIDSGIHLGHLMGTLEAMVHDLLGAEMKTRFRPSYFPFTEPSLEMDVSCAVCQGVGCGTCKGTGWVEILGSGMIHPRVLEHGGYDSERVTGFAFGLGIERVAMRLYGLDDLRLLYQNDLLYLSTFKSLGRSDMS